MVVHLVPPVLCVRPDLLEGPRDVVEVLVRGGILPLLGQPPVHQKEEPRRLLPTGDALRNLEEHDDGEQHEREGDTAHVESGNACVDVRRDRQHCQPGGNHRRALPAKPVRDGEIVPRAMSCLEQPESRPLALHANRKRFSERGGLNLTHFTLLVSPAFNRVIGSGAVRPYSWLHHHQLEWARGLVHLCKLDPHGVPYEAQFASLLPQICVHVDVILLERCLASDRGGR
mmetsp:Transcript_22843/g.50104  ORF Transcript_22843/g.50104 Transcript_22843/m.50104 type:complete len:229 (+) Transcript_22843:284-970(+)